MKKIIITIEVLRAQLLDLDSSRERAVLLTELEKYDALVRYYLGGVRHENSSIVSKPSDTK